jgi:5-methylcytosine-specific restriction endonuclease McrA
MSNLKNKIIELRSQGLSFKQISETLDCSKGTVCYYLTKGQKEKSKLRTRNYRKKVHPFLKKLQDFTSRKPKLLSTKNQTSTNKKLFYKKMISFLGFRNKKGFKMKDFSFTVEDVISKLSESPRCYLSGELIDISKPRTYHFDHKVPVSRGGENTLDNLGICTKQINSSKTDMTPEEYIELCKKVLEHNGYIVSAR